MRRNYYTMIAVFIISVFLTSPSVLYAGRIDTGTWKQTSSTAGDCPDCRITVTQHTPHIIKLEANNGWLGFAYYIPANDEYKGFMELKKGAKHRKENWKNIVFSIRLVRERMTLNLDAESEPVDFSATYRLLK